MSNRPIINPDVQAVFDSYDEATRDNLLMLRQWIYEVASETEGVGELEETLKWGQPSYLTKSKSGSTIRLDQVDTRGRFAMYVICRTNLIDTFRHRFSDRFNYEGNRAILFEHHTDIPEDELKHCIALALTYHRWNR